MYSYYFCVLDQDHMDSYSTWRSLHGFDFLSFFFFKTSTSAPENADKLCF